MEDKLISGIQLFKDNKFSEAIETLNEYLAFNAFEVQALYARGISHRKLDDHQKSLEDLDRACNLLPTDADLISERAVTKVHLKQFNEAIEDFQKALDLDDKNPYRYSSLAFVQAKAGMVFEAIENYEKTIELDPEDAIALNNLGLLEEQIGYKDSSKKRFEKADSIMGKSEGDQYKDVEKLREEAISKIKERKTKTSELITKRSKPNLIKTYFQTISNLVSDKDERSRFLKFLFKGRE